MLLPPIFFLVNSGFDAVAPANGRAVHMLRHELAFETCYPARNCLTDFPGVISFPIVKASPIVDKA
jgi:hypothetical protein